MRALLSLLLLVGCSGGVDPTLDPESLWLRPAPPVAPALPDGARMRVMTLNVHGGQDSSPERILAALGPLSLDVLALQECPGALADVLGPGLGLAHRAGDEGNVLLSRTALTSTRSVSMMSGRGFVSARSEIDGASVSLYGVHIGWNVEGDRQARELLDQHVMPDPSRRVLLMGDFNDEHLSSQATILEEELEDAFTALGLYPGQRISWPATGFDGSEGSQLIDLVYYRKAFAPIVVSADVLNFAPVLSDHKPSLVELVFPRGDAPFSGDPFPGRREPWAVVAIDPAKNALINPGAELDGMGWLSEDGEIATGEREHQLPHGGSKHFAGTSQLQEQAIAGWSQRVALDGDSGDRWVHVAGWMAVGYRADITDEIVSNIPKPYDEAEVIVDLDDGAGKLLSRWSSGRRDPLAYHPFGAKIEVPIGARGATMRLVSHRKDNSGTSHDALFDDLYLAVESGPKHGRTAELARVDGEEKEDFGTWKRLDDGAALGVVIYPSRTRSGAGCFAAGPTLGSARAEGRRELDVEPGVLHFGGWARTMGALGAVELALELFEEDTTTPWARFALPGVAAAEWSLVEGRVRVPDGITRAAIVATGDATLDSLLIDELFVRPEP